MTAAPRELDEFCRVEYPRVLGALILYTGEPLLAEELTQDAFVRVCRDWAKVSRMGRPGAWAHRVAMNLARSRFRRRGSRRRAETRLQAGAVAASMPSTADAVAIRDAVAALADDERAVIALRYFAHLPVADVATALDVPAGTIKTRTRRAIAALSDMGLAIDELDDEPELLLEVLP
ncbi:MAG: sigma-70 family RNA polymerase sigma factor [Acidimicrobiales bacterium]|nr:sigma-70 family RNA polymerase sigma factor [Acidimicrobiales bacterium]